MEKRGLTRGGWMMGGDIESTGKCKRCRMLNGGKEQRKHEGQRNRAQNPAYTHSSQD